MEPLQPICFYSAAVEAANKGGEIVLSNWDKAKAIEFKSSIDLVTEVRTFFFSGSIADFFFFVLQRWMLKWRRR